MAENTSFEWVREVGSCPCCMGEALVPEEANIRCAKCNSDFPVRHHVPLLTPEPVKHLRRIKALSVEKPAWYLKRQIEYHDKGPYRVHLKRRQDYVGNVLKTIIGQTHMDAVISQARMLDLGCGDGTNLRWLKDFGFLLYGLDYNLERVARARSLTPPEVRIALADVMYLPVRSCAFHFVYCNHVLEHVRDDRQALANIHRILAPGGILILGVPNEGAEWWQLAFKLEPESLAKTDHVHFYTGRSLADLSESVGFKVLELKYMGYGLPHWSADGIFRGMAGMDDFMEELGQKFFPDQASSMYLILQKQQ